MSLTDQIKSKALELGFDIVGITDTSPISSEQVKIFQSWLESGCAGQMSYMHKNLDKRTNPSQLIENAQSIIIVGLNYTPPKNSISEISNQMGKIASYACYEDYHTFIKQCLRELVDFINEYRVTSDKSRATSKICVDSAPLAERILAFRAGLGFIGKNHILINPQLGCKIFLGEIITDLKLEFDKPSICHSERSAAQSRNLLKTICSHCDKCIEVCPTGALRPDGFLDARKCINYLTIEYKGEISPELSEKIGDKLFGCEECIEVCPYQENAPVCKNKQFRFYPEHSRINPEEILNLEEKSFTEKFNNSVIQRAGLQALKRNARICIDNTK